jgi:hypothetical protein
MTTFLAECYVSAAHRPDEVAALMRSGTDAAAAEGVDVKYIRSIVVPGDETCFHVFEAGSAEAVTDVSLRVAVPLVRIVEAVERPQEERQ